MILVVPAATAVTRPEAEFTVATAVLLLLHVPPVVALLSVVEALWQTVCVPVMVPALLMLATVGLLEMKLSANPVAGMVLPF